MVAVQKSRSTAQTEVPVQIIDCDVHPGFRHADEILEYMDSPWKDRVSKSFRGRSVYNAPHLGGRLDSIPPGGGKPGSDPDFMDQQLLRDTKVDIALLLPQGLSMSPVPDPDFNAASRTAINRWQAETWLTKYNAHGRYRGSILVPVDNPAAAVREIEMWADHPDFVQVLVPHSTSMPFGNPYFHPIWEAAARHGLPVALHVSSGGKDPMVTPVGYFQYFLEYHSVGYALTYAAHLVSLVCEGVFAKYPDFRFVFVEGGFSWLAPVMWRLDKNWIALRAEVPELTRSPSDYIHDQVRFTSQPVEEPANPRDLIRLFELMDAERLLMFATDYPHWDSDDPFHAFPRMPAEMKQRILFRNAQEFYGLPRVRPLTPGLDK